MSDSRDPTRRSVETGLTKRDDNVGVRGCYELIIKLIILAIVVAALLGYLFTEQERSSKVIAGLVALILLILGLIWKQGHFVRLICKLTAPKNCVHGDAGILTNHVLEPILGTAAGAGFSHYLLELVYKGSVIPDGVIYPDAASSPDTTATQGDYQVNNGTLGWVDVHEAAKGAGADLLNTTTFTVRLRVVGKDNSEKICTTIFNLSAASSFIKKIGTAWSHRYWVDDEPLQRPAPPGSPTSPPPSTPSVPSPATDNSSVGGKLYVRGTADAFGCTGEKIVAVRVWEIPGFSYPAQANGTPTATAEAAMPAGSDKISEVLYTNDDQRQHNVLSGSTSEGNILTYHDGWFQRYEVEWVDSGLMLIHIIPDIREKKWSTPATGQYTLLLQVEDSAGNTYYDLQRVWVDNDPVKAEITSIGGLSACLDLNLSNYVGTTAEIRGYAWDSQIVTGDNSPPSNNFAAYSLRFQKNGGSDGPIAVATPGVKVPNVDTLPAPDGVLADWDVVAALDGGTSPGPAQLGRGERCAYVIDLDVTDRTQRGEGGSGHHAQHLYAINVINDL